MHDLVTPSELWSAWTLDPIVVAALALAAWAYGAGTAKMWRRAGRGRGVRIAQVISFYASLGIFTVALISPVHALGEALFSAHMLQHLLLILVAPPLLVFGAPATPIMLALPVSFTRPLREFRHRQPWRAGVRVLQSAIVVWALHTLASWAWHLPNLYQRALGDEVLHALEHTTFFATALLVWSLVIGTARRRRLSYAAAILLVFATGLQGAALGAILTFASVPLYPIHAAGVHAWDVTPMLDQQLAGLLMWVPAGIVYLLVMARLFLRWLEASDPHGAPADTGVLLPSGERS